MNDYFVREKWNVLNARLFNLFNAARFVNERYGPNTPQAFPVGLTLGSSRQRAYQGVVNSQIPRTTNLLIEEDTHRLKVCDFGEYTQWNDEMSEAYGEILSRTRLNETAEM